LVLETFYPPKPLNGLRTETTLPIIRRLLSDHKVFGLATLITEVKNLHAEYISKTLMRTI